jgi:hypothetical protein
VIGLTDAERPRELQQPPYGWFKSRSKRRGSRTRSDAGSIRVHPARSGRDARPDPASDRWSSPRRPMAARLPGRLSHRRRSHVAGTEGLLRRRLGRWLGGCIASDRGSRLAVRGSLAGRSAPLRLGQEASTTERHRRSPRRFRSLEPRRERRRAPGDIDETHRFRRDRRRQRTWRELARPGDPKAQQFPRADVVAIR